MKRASRLNLRNTVVLTPAVVLGFTYLVTLAACSSGNDQSTGGTGSGGTTSSGGSSGSSGSGASGGSSGSAGQTGSGGMTASGGMASGGMASGGMASGGKAGGASTCVMTPVPTLPDCPASTLTTALASCAKIGCHKGTYASAHLDLTPDMCLVSRIKDVQATHGDIPCPGNAAELCVPATCPAGAKLVDSGNVNNSWILQKLNAMQNGCGDAMPPPNYSIDATGKACVQSLVQAIAALPK